MHRKFEEIDQSRRHLLSTAAFSLVAAKFGLVGSASARSKTPGQQSVSQFFPGFSAEKQIAQHLPSNRGI
jgi:hypothetical protein